MYQLVETKLNELYDEGIDRPTATTVCMIMLASMIASSSDCTEQFHVNLQAVTDALLKFNFGCFKKSERQTGMVN